jgi:signal transduction histidine kinase
MLDQRTPHTASADKKLTDLALLYRFSNTLLSTIRLNKLIHLILTALTSGSNPLFERSMLFLSNEKSGALQGMLGVSNESSEGLVIVGDEDSLGSRLDISDEAIARQRTTAFCIRVRATRIDIDEACDDIKQVLVENQLYYSAEAGRDDCPACDSIRRLGADFFAAIPLMSRDKNIGIIVVDNPASGARITLEDLHFLQLFASQAGMAIENSMLYNRIEDAHSNLRDARERLVHGERLAAIGEMATYLVHELKNPIVTIGGFPGRLLKALSPESREHRYADTIFRETNRLEKMLAEILIFSSNSPIYCNRCDIEAILHECIESCTAILEDYGISLVTSFKGGPWPVKGDAHQLKQVFLNLLLNACEAMPDGGTIRVAGLKEFLDKHSVTVTISDSGGGIQPNILFKIFNPFFTTKPHGTGLGLAIVNRILLNHGGTIEAVNEGPGALFRINLPLMESDSD